MIFSISPRYLRKVFMNPMKRCMNSAASRNGRPIPRAYDKSSRPPFSAVSCAPATIRMVVSTGPTQGVQPNAKASPTT